MQGGCVNAAKAVSVYLTVFLKKVRLRRGMNPELQLADVKMNKTVYN